MRRLVFALLGLPFACAGANESASSVVAIPSYAEDAAPAASEAPPPRAEPLPPEPEDPFPYFVGTWNGLANGHLPTVLVIRSDGTFKLDLEPTPQRGACDLDGRVRVSAQVVYMDVAHSSCAVEQAGTTLERVITQKSADEFSVRSRDDRMNIRYTRKR